MEKIKTELMMGLADLRHPDRNIRRHPEKQIKEMKRSLEKFGQFRPIVIDETNTVLCGNGLLDAMREMGFTEAKVLKYENLSENDKKKLMIADNQVAALGVDDYGAIEDFIKSMDGDIDIPGYDEETIKMITDEAESAINATMSYGIYAAEEVEGMKNVERDRMENGIKPVEQAYAATEPSVAPAPVVPTPAAEEQSGKVYAKPQETEKYIICPHCGEKIYI